MKKLFTILPVALALAWAPVCTVLAQDDQTQDQYWGDYAYDEQQWWNPADWFDDTPNYWSSYGTDYDWDYGYDWYDNDWYDYGYYDNEFGAGSDMYDYDFGYGSDIYDPDYGLSGDLNDGILGDDSDWFDTWDYGL